MSKKLLLSWALAIVAALTCAIGASAGDEVEYDFSYVNLKFVITSPSTAKVVGCMNSSPSGSWIIPATATYSNNTYDVTAVDAGAFMYCDRITEMEIANSVDSIGQYAFYYCTRLASVTMPSTIKEIGMYAFCGCEGLLDVELPEGLTIVKSCVFYGCTSLTSVKLPNTLETIDSSAFYGCSDLTSVTIPNSVTYIGGNAFNGCSSMTTLLIGENCTFYRNGGWPVNIFAGCTSLSSIISLSQVAGPFHESVFEQTVYDNAVLHVPRRSIASYQSTDCWNRFAHVEGFNFEGDLDEVLNVPGGTIHFVSPGDYPWITMSEDGREYAQSGNAGVPSSVSILAATVTVDEESTVSFDFKAWGEGLSTVWDKCVFAVDATEVFRYGAYQNADWETFEVNLAAGTHTLTWRYTKDDSVDPTGDYFAIDNVAVRINLDPALNVEGGKIHFITEGDYPWIPVSDDGRDYAESGNGGISSSESILTATVNVVVNSTLSFDFKAWGEGSSTYWDKCEFDIDGVMQCSYGAYQNVNWETFTVDLPVGVHTLTWSYTKDSSVHPYGDYFAIDNVAITAKPVAPRGDVNNDGEVTIADVTALIDYLLSGDDSGINLDAADCDVDGSVGISDVTALIDYLLSGGWPSNVFTVGGVSFKMIPVQGGIFMMGASDDDTQASGNEKPAHQVTLSTYRIGETEVTQALWVAVMGSNPSSHSSSNGYEDDLSRPVEEVSWEDCQTFISKLNQMTGKTFRLPTEAEWEYAARGGSYSHNYVYSGGNDLNAVAWYRDNGDYQTHPVAQKLPNELGLYDMSGNVYEWCQDWYDSYSSEAQINPTGPTSGTRRVCRGGNAGDLSNCRVSFRNYSQTSSATDGLGLRLAL